MSPEPGQTADLPQAHPQVATEPELGSERSSGALSLKDKLALNRRAKAHGLPALWPEAEEETRLEWNRQYRVLLESIGLGQHQPFPLGISGWPSLSDLQGDPAFGRGNSGYLYPGLEEIWCGSLLGDVADAFRSLFSRFRGPLPW